MKKFNDDKLFLKNLQHFYFDIFDHCMYKYFVNSARFVK